MLTKADIVGNIMLLCMVAKVFLEVVKMVSKDI